MSFAQNVCCFKVSDDGIFTSVSNNAPFDKDYTLSNLVNGWFDWTRFRLFYSVYKSLLELKPSIFDNYIISSPGASGYYTFTEKVPTESLEPGNTGFLLTGVASGCSPEYYKSMAPVYDEEYFNMFVKTSKEKSEVTRPLTKEEAKLKRQETQAGATLLQVKTVLDKVTAAVESGKDSFLWFAGESKSLVLAPETLAALKEVFPYITLKVGNFEPGKSQTITVEFSE